MFFSVAINREPQGIGKCVYDGNADAMQTAGYFVRIVVELPAGMQNSHDDFCSRSAFFFVDVYRNAATIVGNGNGVVGMYDNFNIVTVASKSLVNGIVDNFKHHVVEAGAVISVANIHTGALTHRIKSTQDFNVGGVISVTGSRRHKIPIPANTRIVILTHNGRINNEKVQWLW